MIIPEYWAKGEAKVHKTVGKDFFVHAWGWSNTSLQEAQKKAKEAAQVLAARLVSGDDAHFDEQYDSRPLREKVVERFRPAGSVQESAITRNLQGCLVLNTDSFVIVDVDFRHHKTPGLFERVLAKIKGWEIPKTNRDAALMFVREYAKENPNHKYRIYETRAGFRVMVTTARLSPDSDEAEELMNELGGDPLYIKLCRVHNSYRARLTPKPHRVGLKACGLKYPFEKVEDETLFLDWSQKYEAASKSFAVCRFVEELGTGQTVPSVQELLKIHDQYTAVRSDRLQLA